MKRKWHIRRRVLVTLIGLTCAVLLVVALAFNLTMRAYIRSRVSAQLTTISASAALERRGDPREHEGGKPFDERPDRMIGTRGNAIVLDANGMLCLELHGDDTAGAELAAYFQAHGLTGGVKDEVISLDSGSYAVSVEADPVEDGRFLVVYVDVTSLTALTDQINLMLLLVILAAILLSVFLSRLFARSFAQPVQRLSAFAEEIGGGDLTPRTFQFLDLEFEALADSMNRMAAELRAAKQKQETFFQNVSHELRTPLTSIRGNAEGIVYGVMEPQRAAKVILSESDQLGGMVEDILYLSRMGRAAPEGKAEPLDLRELLSLCVSEQRAEADRRGVRFDFDFDEAPVLLPIREPDAQRLFGNLISNAIRYAESRVHLVCRSTDGAVCVQVSDDGPGISPDDLPHVFERFYKGKGGKHGIGLAIAQSVAETYHGRLTARNDGGAVFEARFPSPSQE